VLGGCWNAGVGGIECACMAPPSIGDAATQRCQDNETNDVWDCSL
jgi:hypothetical protein